MLARLLTAIFLSVTPALAQSEYALAGTVSSISGSAISGAQISSDGPIVPSDQKGNFQLHLRSGTHRLRIEALSFAPLTLTLDIQSDRELQVILSPATSVTVHAETDALSPDPSAQAYARDDLLEANPGRPGIPLSVPGYPTETASGGIKAPQYFAPGVAGDHGEPIAQYFQIGGYLFQNNLSANAHGNGYADPNIIIPATIDGVSIDDAAYNARYGDHSVNLAVTYDLSRRLTSYLQATTDGRDADLSAGWSPANPDINEWFAVEASVGNGFLSRPEERQQYKLNGSRNWKLGKHNLTAFALAYYGFARIPGLIPLYTPVQDDTIDARQADLTHTTLALVTDQWGISSTQQLQLSAFLRTYSLELKSNFGDGLIRQSEFRTVDGGNATYQWQLHPKWTLLAGADLRRDAPRDLNLAHADSTGAFHLITSNDLTIIDAAAFGAVNANFSRNFQIYLGVRHDQIKFDNADLLTPANSFTRWPGVTSPKATITIGRSDAPILPSLSLSIGEAFHVNDPRIGNGSGMGDLIIRSRAYQIFAVKQIANTELRLTLARITSSAELAKIDPDTGLQQNVGPSLNRFVTLAVRRRYSRGFLEASYSQADAQDRELHQPVPEAPRLIVDAIASIDHLPFGLQAKSEYEYVGEKPLGDGFKAIPVQEIRLNLSKSFADGRLLASISGVAASGYTGQTLETFAFNGEPAPTERIVGIPQRSFATLSLNYAFRH